MRPGDPRITLLTEVSGLRKLERVYNEVGDRHGDDFVRVLLEQLGVHLEVDPDDLARVPKQGGVAFVANHPYGAVDGLALLHVLSGVRPDLKVMANFLLQQLEPLADSFIGVNPFEQLKARSSFQGMRAALQHLGDGGALGVFPAGEVSSYRTELKAVADLHGRHGLVGEMADLSGRGLIPVDALDDGPLAFLSTILFPSTTPDSP